MIDEGQLQRIVRSRVRPAKKPLWQIALEAREYRRVMKGVRRDKPGRVYFVPNLGRYRAYSSSAGGKKSYSLGVYDTRREAEDAILRWLNGEVCDVSIE